MAVEIGEVGGPTAAPRLHDLPVEILHSLTLLLQPDEVRGGIFGASRYLRDVFSDDVYWMLRCKRQYPARWTELSGNAC